jgi:hypothetical protein
MNMNWINTLKPLHADPEYVQRKLVEEKKFIDLGDMFSGVSRASTDEESLDIESIREKTLTYLQKLLEENQVVAGRIILLKPGQPVPDTETARNSPVFEDIPGTPEEVIEYIRYNWNNNSEFTESYDCVFRLPKNDWPMFW